MASLPTAIRSASPSPSRSAARSRSAGYAEGEALLRPYDIRIVQEWGLKDVRLTMIYTYLLAAWRHGRLQSAGLDNDYRSRTSVQIYLAASR
ncbi:MAG: hypothetical protein H5T64_12100 [Chloroflexi bacterium]|nr:hypothetical protein [Chloroflexota bacterium]